MYKEFSKKTLVCFTSSYPYGVKETYFEIELQILSKAFKQIIIIPAYNPYSTNQRQVPNNVKVYPPLLRQGVFRILDFFCYLKISKGLINEFFKKNVYRNSSSVKQWVLAMLSYGTNYKKFEEFNFNKDEVILYSYWAGKLFFIENSLKSFLKVIRMHGADFYEERSGGYLPLREMLYNSADLLLPISKDIKGRLEAIYNVPRGNIKLSYLGVLNSSKYSSVKIESKCLNIISCSNVYSLKRIHLIYEILKFISEDITINWTHIGSGELLKSLKEKVKSDYRSNISVSFLGNKSQLEIQKIYSDNYFDLFINTSRFEGLPVSIMEAYSYGIPAIATDVGGTNEIVNLRNGMLIAKNFNVSEIAKLIETSFLNNDLLNKRVLAFETWEKHFNAEINYTNLIKELLAL